MGGALAWDSVLFGGRTAVARRWLERGARLLAEAEPGDLVELVLRFDRLDGDAVAIPSTYTEAIAVTS